MTPDQHYAEAERLLEVADAESRKFPATPVTSNTAQAHIASLSMIHGKAQVHFIAALAGFVRDAATAHVHDVVTPVLGGTPIRDTTTTGRPA